jgi:spore coat polysaccharide biosynthesis protein SpsF
LTLNTVAIIQARMTSTRLPGKVLMKVAGRPMLLQEVHRLERSIRISDIVIATTTNVTDDPIVNLARKTGIRCHRGSESDVLGRFVDAVKLVKADVIVRLTADCPLIDPEIMDSVIAELVDHSNECDYASNVIHRTYPRGLDVEALFCDTLFRLDRLAQSKLNREHVTTYLRSGHPELFLIRSVEDNQNNADLRWTVDTQKDYELVCKVYESMHLDRTNPSYREILAYVRKHPETSQLNSDIKTWEPTKGTTS